MEDSYYVSWQGNQIGPISSQLLLRGVETGKVPSDALACVVGASEWQPIQAIVSSVRKASAPEYHVQVEDRVVGPIAGETIRRGLEIGKVPKDALVCKVGTTSWLFAGDVFSEIETAEPFPSQPTVHVISPVVRAPREDAAPHEVQAEDTVVENGPRRGDESERGQKRLDQDRHGLQVVVAAVSPSEPDEKNEERPDRPFRLLQESAGRDTLDLSGADGRSGEDGRQGRNGKDGIRLKKGGYSAGGNGTAGTNGKSGSNGRKARSADLILKAHNNQILLTGGDGAHIVKGSVTIDASGGNGGYGGDGGAGGRGGSGSPSGRAGATGSGGDGGDGGDGGNITVSTQDAHLLGLLGDVSVRGGSAGRGGSGSPPGRSGTSGTPGSFSFSAKNPRTRGTEVGDSFGLTVEDVLVADDGSRLAGHFTRGSRFIVESVTLNNKGDFSIFAPYVIGVGAESPVDVVGGAIPVVEHHVEETQSVPIDCSVGVRIRSRCDIGHYRLRIGVFSERCDRLILLTKNREDGILPVSVNHRLYSSEIIVASDHERALVDHLVVRWNARAPEEQLAFFTAVILTAASFGATISMPKRAELSTILAGRLVDSDELWKHVGTPESVGEAAVASALHFFLSVPRDTQSKLMDASYFVACGDGVLEVREKEFLRWLGGKFGLLDDWFFDHMPRVLENGASKARASASNLPAIIAFPAFALGTFMLGERVLSQSTWFNDTSLRFSPLFTVLGGFASVVASIHPYRLLFFSTACRDCGSLHLKPISRQTRDGSLVGEVDALRCVDCGSRGNLSEGHKGELVAADCGVDALASRVPAGTLLFSGGTLAIGVFAHIYLSTSVAPASSPATLGGVLLFAALVAWLFGGARRVDGTVLVWVSGIPTLLTTILVGYSQWLGTQTTVQAQPVVVDSSSKQAAIPPTVSSRQATVGNTGGEGVFLRRTPNPADKLRALPEGTTIELTGRSQKVADQDWFEVKTPDGTAWIPGRYVQR